MDVWGLTRKGFCFLSVLFNPAQGLAKFLSYGGCEFRSSDQGFRHTGLPVLSRVIRPLPVVSHMVIIVSDPVGKQFFQFFGKSQGGGRTVFYRCVRVSAMIGVGMGMIAGMIMGIMGMRMNVLMGMGVMMIVAMIMVVVVSMGVGVGVRMRVMIMMVM